MVNIEWSTKFSWAISSTQLSDVKKDLLRDAIHKFDGWEYAITPSVMDGDLQLDIRINADNKATTITDATYVARDILTKQGITDLAINLNADEGYATIVVKTDSTGMSDNTPQGQAEAANQQPAQPTPPNPSTTIATAPQPAVEAKPVTYADTPSTSAKAGVGQNSKNTSEFYINVEVYIEGVQVPHSSATVSYGLNSPPTCTILIPASSIIRDLPENTKVHIFFEDLLPDDTGVYQWRLLFDGELSGFSYTVDPNGANMSINAIHSTAYLTLMQIMTLDSSEYLFNPNQRLIGDATIPLLFGQNKVNSSIISGIMKGKNFESMADIVFQLMRAVLDGTQSSDLGKWYHDKLSNGINGLKLLKRIFGISAKAANSPVPSYETQYKADGTLKGSTTTGNSGSSGSSGGSALTSNPVPSGDSNSIVAAGLAMVGQTGRDGIYDGITNFECDGFVTACLRNAGVEPTGWPEHYVPTQQSFLMSRGLYETNSSSVQPGDIIYMNQSGDGPDHTGIFMRDASGKGYLLHNSSSLNETCQQPWEPPGFSGLDFVGFGRVQG